jgi:MFS family permease
LLNVQKNAGCPLRRNYGELVALPTEPIYVITASCQSLWAALEQLMTGVGSLSTRSIADRFGRRFVFFLAGIFSTPGVAILYTWNTALGYLVGKKFYATFIVFILLLAVGIGFEIS